MEPSLIIAGWSARAAVQSARRAGWSSVAAIDTFLDADLLRDTVDARRIATADELATAAASWPAAEWLYVGGVENYPEAVAEVSRRHRLLGMPPEALRRVRDPFLLQQVVVDGGFACPEMHRLDGGPAPTAFDGRWLAKRPGTAGGFGVARLSQQTDRREFTYVQRRIPGDAYGATFVGAGGAARLLGVCRQLTSALDPQRPFRFGGAIGPIDLPPRVIEPLRSLGARLAAAFDLVGLFGVDFILDNAATVWTLEVNPRYTASVEVLERATGAAFLAWHAAACRDGALPDAAAGLAPAEVHGKRIVYFDGQESLTIAAALSARLLADDADAIADVPAAGAVVRPGDPLATVFAAGATVAEVERQLADRERRLLESVRGPA